MITPEEFPYIKSLHVNDCYAYQDFDIDLHDYKPFSHLILTGKNGSGKSTILQGVNIFIATMNVGGYNNQHTVVPDFTEDNEHRVHDRVNESVYSFIRTKRDSKLSEVNSVVNDDQLASSVRMGESVSIFKQFLVNKKVSQAFSQLENDHKKIEEIDDFFKELTDTFRKILEDDRLELIFERNNFEFYIRLSDGRKITFNTLSDGFSAFISIFIDLFIRVDLIRKQENDYSYNPCGIVLIDEPETHLHLQLQEQVLPLLTSLFPNVQFIAATHSPAVIASIRNATIYDLTTKESRISEDTAGRSYSELMRGHFGLDNEYSAIADEIFRKADQLLKAYKHQPEKLRVELQQLFIENEAYLSPSFRVELESMILENA